MYRPEKSLLGIKLILGLMKTRVKKITDEEKHRYVDLYRTGEYSLREIASMGGFSYQALFKWVKDGTTSRKKSRYIDMGKVKKPQAVDPRDAEIARLKAALEKAELRAHALDTMIRVAETNLNIKIRKKVGAKQ